MPAATPLTRLFGPWVLRVDRRTLAADGVAGVLGALLVLPQAIAFASLAGLPPVYGLATAVVPCIVAALFGSSRHVVSGPTNANSLALAATLAPLAALGSPQYIQLALTVTLLVGALQFLIGALRLGSVANFISPSALRGFMSGAALLIVLHSLPDVLGLAAPESRGLAALFQHLSLNAHDIEPAAVIVAAVTLVAAALMKQRLPRLPHLLIALLLGLALAEAINRAGGAVGLGPVRDVGAIPAGLPRPRLPAVDWQSVPDLIGIAFALTIVALGQSISIAKAVAARSGQAIDANREFRGQGLSNLVGGFFSCYVSCGSLNRSMPNFEAGARTPLAAVFASCGLLLLIAVSAPLLARIPLPGIAGLLTLIAWSLLDIPGWRRLWRVGRRDFAIAAATGLATVTIRLEMAILLGTILSLVTFLYRTSKPWMRVMGFDTPVDPNGAPSPRPFVVRVDVPAPLPECPQLTMVRMEGEVYFGAVAHVSDQLRELRGRPGAARHLLVMCKSMNFIDLAGAELWQAELANRRGAGGDLWFHRPRAPVLELWQRVGFMRALGPDHIFPAKRVAIRTIFGRLDREICARCTVRLYEECQALPPPSNGADAV